MQNKTDKKRIVLLINTDKPQIKDPGRKLLYWLQDRAEILAHNIDNKLDLSNLPKADFIIVLGGDGTILATVRALGENQIPLIGVNMGKLGFLADFSIEQLMDQFDHITTTQKPYTVRTMLNCRVIGPGHADFCHLVVNEITITAGPPFRMIGVSLSIADEELLCCAGDGLIVATPTGSTAYNLSAGGPILSASIHAAVITPLAAHSLSFRPIVVDLDKPIELRCRDIHKHPQSDAQQQYRSTGTVLVIDGQKHTPLTAEDKVIISPAQARFLLVQNPKQSQWRLLSNKLNWAALPNYSINQT